ncbi:MAG: plasmid mobilization relaxosome protein MobC [Burkholderiales bacterium]
MTIDRRRYNEHIRELQKARGVHRVSVTLSAAEYERLKRCADEQGERVTTHLKRRAFAHIHTRYLVPHDIADQLNNLLAVLRGIGNNLNQLARHSNEMRYFLDTEEVRLHLKRLDEEVRRFVTEPDPERPGPRP